MLIYNLLLLVPGRGTKPSLGAIRFSKACKLESKITPYIVPARCALKGGFPVNASGVKKRAFRISPLGRAQTGYPSPAVAGNFLGFRPGARSSRKPVLHPVGPTTDRVTREIVECPLWIP